MNTGSSSSSAVKAPTCATKLSEQGEDPLGMRKTGDVHAPQSADTHPWPDMGFQTVYTLPTHQFSSEENLHSTSEGEIKIQLQRNVSRKDPNVYGFSCIHT